MLASIAAVIGGLVVLMFSADRFIAGAASLARRLGVPALLVGLTVVGIGTSAPEMVVSIMASLEAKPGIAVGNVVGSNIANLTLVLGTAAALSPLTVHSRLLSRELPIVAGASLLMAVLFLDDALTLFDGLLLLVGLAAVLTWFARLARAGESDPIAAEIEAGGADDLPVPRAVAWLIVGLVLLPLSSRALVWGASNIAAALGVSELVIGLTIVAVGTSLPEVATVLAAVMRREYDLVLGNVVGSNLFNTLAVLPMPALIAPGALSHGVLIRDLPIMLAVTGLVYILCRGRETVLGRSAGLVLLVTFVGYQALLFTFRLE